MITINHEKCNNCGKCYEECPDYVISLKENNKGKPVEVRYPEQCCNCGHCISICPAEAITHKSLPMDQFEELPEIGIRPEDMKKLIFSRRSTRNYKDKPVPDEAVDQLLESAVHAGSGGNIQTEGFIVIKNQKVLHELESLVVDTLWNAGIKFAHGNGLIFKVLSKKFGPELSDQYRGYHGIIKHRRQNNEIEGMIFRHAPLVIVVHGLKKNNLAKINAAVALRNIELLAHTMGLGTCWSGFLIGAAEKKSSGINRFLGLKGASNVCGALMVGYPKYHYKHKLPRKKRDVRYI